MQKSVFECLVDDKTLVELREALLDEMVSDEDSIRFYPLVEGAKDRIEHHGRNKPRDQEEPTII